MRVYLCNCSMATIEFIKYNYKNKEYEFIVTYTLEEVLHGLEEVNKASLIILEVSGLNSELLFHIRSKEYNIVILALFDKLKVELTPLLINNKAVDFIDWLPVNSKESIDAAIKQVIVMTEYNTKSSTSSDVSAWTQLRKHTEFRDMITMEYIYDLIYGEVSRVDAINNITYMLNLNKIPNTVFTLMVDDFWDICVNLDNKQRYHIKRVILNLVKESIRDYNATACSLIGTDKIIILLDLSDCHKDLIQDTIFKIANYIKDFIKTNSKYTVTLGIGNVYDDYENIWRAYEEAFQAINYSFSLGKDIIVQYKDINNLAGNKSLNYDFVYFEYQLFKNLSRSDEGIILDFYDNIFNSIINKRYKSDTIKSIINKFTYDILQYCIELGLNQKLISIVAMETSTQILRASSITSIRDVGRKFLEKISRNILEFTKGNNDLSLDASIIFINKYYYKNITLADVAHVTNMSESHFSRKFKERYGINFVNYLVKTRLEKAEELLLESSLSVEEVAKKVGFNDIPYFSKSFKSKYNMSPSRYRSKI